VLVAFWLVAEPLRLLAGYYGNLQENVGLAARYWLAGCCWLLGPQLRLARFHFK
jgi:hypothetical protein